MQGPSTLTNLSNVEDLYVTPISFNEAAIFIFSISFTVSTVTQTATRQATSQDTCAVVFIGQDSEIVLTSNFVVDSGTVNSLAVITIPEEEQNIFFVSEYTQFLDSSILVTGGFLITTQPCIVEGMKIEVNASIRETDAESLNFQEILEIATNITSETARNILQLVSPSDSSPSTSDSSPITDSSPSYSERTLIIAVVVPVGVLGIATLILLVLLLRWRFQRKKSSMLPAPILESPGVSPTVFTSMILENAEALEHTSGAFNNHSYALLRYTENEYERQDPVRDKFASKYGVSAPFYDFTDYNRQRSGSLINDWEYPRSNLIFMRNLGEGQFGKVLLMKAKCIAGYQGYIPVAVKTLSSTDPEIVRIFMEEAELMKRFSHPNIVSLLGITSKDESEDSSPLLILEYMPHGDLQGFLKSHRPEEGEPSAIAEADLYNFAIDIARALEFLEMSKYVHRDVAARNCLVGSGLRIKMADFGMARGVYDKDYYRVAGRALLPVRWMAPECLLYGMFTSASDVWSYGVVLFEIMTYGKMPLEVMNMQNIVEEVQNGTLRHPRPKNCPDIIYDVMSECHNHEQDQRPTFTKILATLEKIRSDSCVSVGI